LMDTTRDIFQGTERYAKLNRLQGVDGDYIQEEMLGDVMGDAFADPTFWNEVGKNNPTLLARLSMFIRKWLGALIGESNKRGLGSEQWVKDARAMRNAMVKAVREYALKNPEARAILASGDVRYHKAWHGSPHDHDGFDMAKIGTGEGNQLFGYGHYFSSAKAVGEFYKSELTKSFDKNPLPESIPYRIATKIYRDYESSGEDYINKGLENAYGYYGGDNGYLSKEQKDDIKKWMVSYENRDKGKLYETELAPSQDEYLDWDKPLSKQSNTVKSILKFIQDDKLKSNTGYLAPSHYTGKEFITVLEKINLLVNIYIQKAYAAYAINQAR
jgi:hypothetical protein